MRLAAIGLAALFLLPTQVQAQCLETADQAAFESTLRFNMSRSDWTYDQVYFHALNRLGFGSHPGRNNAFDIQRPQRWDHLANLIATSLRIADRNADTVDDQLAALTRDNPQVTDHPKPYFFVNKSKHRAYDHYYQLLQAVTDLRAQVAIDPSLLPQLVEAQQRRGRAARDFRFAAGARRVAHLVASSNVDIGEVLGEFWLNHFNIDARKAPVTSSDYQRALRAKQCGTFFDLLNTSAKHPTMLTYLDNFRSRVGSLNENYGRELLELHTLGDDTFRYYNQDDVRKAARVLTGWSMRRTQAADGSQRINFHFYPGGHDGDAVTMFDTAPQGIPLNLAEFKNGNGNNTPDAVRRGNQLLRYLAGHPATRRNICGKLSSWLLGTRRAAIVNGCTDDAVWGTLGDLGAIYQYFLTRREFFHTVEDLDASEWDTVQNIRNIKIKTPLEAIVSTVRATRTPVNQWRTFDGLQNYTRMSSVLGLNPGLIAPPTGYPDYRGWLSSGYALRLQTLLFSDIRTNAVRVVVGDETLNGQTLEQRVQLVIDNAAPLTPAERNTRLDSWSRRITRALGLWPIGDIRRPARRQALLNADERTVAGDPQPVRSLVHAVLGSPEFIRK